MKLILQYHSLRGFFLFLQEEIKQPLLLATFQSLYNNMIF